MDVIKKCSNWVTSFWPWTGRRGPPFRAQANTLIKPREEVLDESSVNEIRANAALLRDSRCGPEVALQGVIAAVIDLWVVTLDCINLLAVNKRRNSKPDKVKQYIDTWTPELIRPLESTVFSIAEACHAHGPTWTEDQRITTLYLTAAAAAAVMTQCPGHGRNRTTVAPAVHVNVRNLKHWFHVSDGALLGRDHSVGVEGCVTRMLHTLTCGRADAAGGCGGRGGEEIFVTQALWEMFTDMCREAQHVLRASIGDAGSPHGLTGAKPLATDAPGPKQTPAALQEVPPSMAPQQTSAAAMPQPSPRLATPPPRDMHTAAPSPPEPVPTQPPDVMEMLQAQADFMEAEAAQRRGKQLKSSAAMSTPAGASSARAGQKRARGDTAQDPSAQEHVVKAFRAHSPTAHALFMPVTELGEQHGAGAAEIEASLMLWLSRDLHRTCSGAGRRRTADSDPPPDLDSLASLLQF